MSIHYIESLCIVRTFRKKSQIGPPIFAIFDRTYCLTALHSGFAEFWQKLFDIPYAL